MQIHPLPENKVIALEVLHPNNGTVSTLTQVRFFLCKRHRAEEQGSATSIWTSNKEDTFLSSWCTECLNKLGNTCPHTLPYCIPRQNMTCPILSYRGATLEKNMVKCFLPLLVKFNSPIRVEIKPRSFSFNFTGNGVKH